MGRKRDEQNGLFSAKIIYIVFHNFWACNNNRKYLFCHICFFLDDYILSKET